MSTTEAEGTPSPIPDEHEAAQRAARDWRTALLYLLSTVAHAVSASFIAVTAFEVAPAETTYLLLAVGVAALLDFDHLYYVLRHWRRYQARRGGNPDHLHQSRTPLHELSGILGAGIVAAFLYPINDRAAGILFVAFTIHVVQDWFLSRPTPLAPWDDTVVHFFDLTRTQKAVIDVTIALVFSVLWILYLTGRV